MVVAVILLFSFSHAFQAEWICKTDLVVRSNKQSFTGSFKMDPMKHATLSVFSADKPVAKIFPMHGIHWIKKASTGRVVVDTDKKSYIHLTYKHEKKRSELSCKEVL